MQQKLSTVKEANRAEALRLANELKRIKLERQFLNADKDKMEEQKFSDLSKGIERSTREKQTFVVAASRLAETVAADQRKLTLLNAYKEHKSKQEFLADYDVRLEQLRTMKVQDEQIEEVIKKERATALFAYQGQSSAVLRVRIFTSNITQVIWFGVFIFSHFDCSVFSLLQTRNPYAERMNEKKQMEATAIRSKRESTMRSTTSH
jgi:hypothetical protein